MNKINNNNIQRQLYNLIIKRNYTVSENYIKSFDNIHKNNKNQQIDENIYLRQKATLPQKQKQNRALPTLQFEYENERSTGLAQVNQERRIVSSDDVLRDGRNLEYVLRMDEEEEMDKLEKQSQQRFKTSSEMAEEYIHRLLIEESRKDALEEEFLFSQISELPEWNDYNDHILRELKKLEYDEIENTEVDNPRLTEYYEKERIKKVDEIRKIHFIHVRDAIYKRYKELDKELDVLIEKKILKTMQTTGLSREELMVHKDYAYLFDEDYDPKNELFEDKDELDLVLESINGPLESVPPVIRSIFGSSKQVFEKDMEFKELKKFKQFESSKQSQHQMQPNKPNNQIDGPSPINTIFSIDDNNKPQYSQSHPKLSITEILKEQSIIKQQMQSQQQKRNLNQQEPFNLRSILNNITNTINK